MSRQSKANPARYTQRGRLTQDDAARELRKQSSIGSPHTWQPVNTEKEPWRAMAGDVVGDSETPADSEPMVASSSRVEKRPVSRVTRKKTATKAAPSTAKAKAAKTKSFSSRQVRNWWVQLLM